jgi:hypothetical protein
MTMRTLLAVLALPLSGANAIDLSPRWIDTSIDGITRRQLFFADGEKKILISTSSETEAAAGSGGTIFRFPKYPNIEFCLTQSTHVPADAFAATKLGEYRETARKLLPAHATGVEIREEVANPVTINAWRSFRMLLRFKHDDQSWLQTVTFVNLNERDQIIAVTRAPETDWNEAAMRSWEILRSWQEMLPGDAGPQRQN